MLLSTDWWQNMRRLVFSLLLLTLSCLSGPEYRPAVEVYPVVSRTMEAVACALVTTYGNRRARELLDVSILTRPDYPWKGHYEPSSGDIYMDAGLSSRVFDEVLRHEFFWHRVPHIIHEAESANPYHAPQYHDDAQELYRMSKEDCE